MAEGSVHGCIHSDSLKDPPQPWLIGHSPKPDLLSDSHEIVVQFRLDDKGAPVIGCAMLSRVADSSNRSSP